MRPAAGIATVLAHAAAFLGLGSIEVRPEPEPPLEVTTIELVELPVAAEPEPAPAPQPEPELAPDPTPEPEPAPEPKPAPPPSQPQPTPQPAAPIPSPEPAAPFDVPTTGSDPGPGPDPAPADAKPAGPRKLGQRYSNATQAKPRQGSTAKRCTEPVVKPVPIHRVKAKFPAAVLRSGISGELVLRANVDRSGAVTAITVVKSPGASVEPAAKAAFAQWRFTPATACGKAVPSTYAKSSKFEGG